MLMVCVFWLAVLLYIYRGWSVRRERWCRSIIHFSAVLATVMAFWTMASWPEEAACIVTGTGIGGHDATGIVDEEMGLTSGGLQVGATAAATQHAMSTGIGGRFWIPFDVGIGIIATTVAIHAIGTSSARHRDSGSSW